MHSQNLKNVVWKDVISSGGKENGTGGLLFCVIFLFLLNDLGRKCLEAEFLFSVLCTFEYVS